MLLLLFSLPLSLFFTFLLLSRPFLAPRLMNLIVTGVRPDVPADWPEEVGYCIRRRGVALEAGRRLSSVLVRMPLCAFVWFVFFFLTSFLLSLPSSFLCFLLSVYLSIHLPVYLSILSSCRRSCRRAGIRTHSPARPWLRCSSLWPG